MAYKNVEGGVTAPKGFKASAVYAGIKSKKSEKPDMALLLSETATSCAAVFTTNKFCAAPVIIGREKLKAAKLRAIIVNSGCANAATGKEGIANADKIQNEAAKLLGLEPDEVIMSSTGTIGVQLPVEKMLEGVKKLVPLLDKKNGHDAAYAIMTTDTVSKEMSFELELSGGTVTMGAMCKGAGMIHPNMATMLAYFTTDAVISADVLQPMLKDAVDKSFNMTTVDGDTSTNDSLFLIANGASGVKVETEADKKAFKEALDYICIGMARKIAADGEGASHLMIVEAQNLQTLKDARLVAKAIAGSNLFKAALFGQDANWGRIIGAAGYSGADFDTEHLDCYLESCAGKIQVMKEGAGLVFDEDKAATILKEKDITVIVDFHDGKECATAYGCDLTYDYVKINGDYRS